MKSIWTVILESNDLQGVLGVVGLLQSEFNNWRTAVQQCRTGVYCRVQISSVFLCRPCKNIKLKGWSSTSLQLSCFSGVKEEPVLKKLLEQNDLA